MTCFGRLRCAPVLVLVAAGLWLTVAVQAKTINVSAGQSIQSAINGAANGDVISGQGDL